MKPIYMIDLIKLILIFTYMLCVVSSHALAAGGLKKLSVIGGNQELKEEAYRAEAKRYKRAKAFISGSEIKKGLTQDFVLKQCGEPVARARDGMDWVYKPPSSTFFKGEKIYLIYDSSKNLIDWKQVNQE